MLAFIKRHAEPLLPTKDDSKFPQETLVTLEIQSESKTE